MAYQASKYHPDQNPIISVTVGTTELRRYRELASIGGGENEGAAGIGTGENATMPSRIVSRPIPLANSGLQALSRWAPERPR
jgi:hypothetical protein